MEKELACPPVYLQLIGKCLIVGPRYFQLNNIEDVSCYNLHKDDNNNLKGKEKCIELITSVRRKISHLNINFKKLENGQTW